MGLHIYPVAIEMLRQLQPGMERIRTRDSNLADQLKRAATSVPLNLHEGAYSQGGNTRARFHTALGSAAEVRACLDVVRLHQPSHEFLKDAVANDVRDLKGFFTELALPVRTSGLPACLAPGTQLAEAPKVLERKLFDPETGRIAIRELARTPEEVGAAVDEFLAGKGPMVLDARMARDAVSITYRRLHYGQDA